MLSCRLSRWWWWLLSQSLVLSLILRLTFRGYKESEVPAPFRGSFSIFLWGTFSDALSFGASSSSLVCPAFFFIGGRALLLGYEGFFTINILLCFCEHLSHACLGIFGDGKHQVFRLNPKPAMNAVIANFSLGIYTFKDSALNL